MRARKKDWEECQAEFVAKRDAIRARECTCGHECGDHFEDVARCRTGCGCGSFKHADAPPIADGPYGVRP